MKCHDWCKMPSMCKVAHPPSMGLPEPLKTLPIISLDTGVLRTCIHREQEVTTLLIYLNLIHHAAVPDTGGKAETYECFCNKGVNLQDIELLSHLSVMCANHYNVHAHAQCA